MSETSGHEFREYRLSGELTTEQWDTLVLHLGHFGLATEVVVPLSNSEDSGVPAEIDSSSILANKSDLFKFAEKIEVNRSLASRGWAFLTRIYSYKVNPAFYGHIVQSWYRPGNFADIPLEFATVPPIYSDANEGKTWFASSFSEGLRDLDIKSLGALLEKITNDLRYHKKLSDLPYMPANKAGVRTIAFLVSFYHDQLNQATEPHEESLVGQDNNDEN